MRGWNAGCPSLTRKSVPRCRAIGVIGLRMVMGCAWWWNHSARVVANPLFVASASHQIGRGTGRLPTWCVWTWVRADNATQHGMNGKGCGPEQENNRPPTDLKTFSRKRCGSKPVRLSRRHVMPGTGITPLYRRRTNLKPPPDTEPTHPRVRCHNACGEPVLGPQAP